MGGQGSKRIASTYGNLLHVAAGLVTCPQSAFVVHPASQTLASLILQPGLLAVRSAFRTWLATRGERSRIAEASLRALASRDVTVCREASVMSLDSSGRRETDPGQRMKPTERSAHTGNWGTSPRRVSC